MSDVSDKEVTTTSLTLEQAFTHAKLAGGKADDGYWFRTNEKAAEIAATMATQWAWDVITKASQGHERILQEVATLRAVLAMAETQGNLNDFYAGTPATLLRRLFDTLLTWRYGNSSNMENKQALIEALDAYVASGSVRKHQWALGNDIVEWEHCGVCGILRRADGLSDHKMCRGPVAIDLRTQP